MELRWQIKKIVRRLGYDIVPYNPLNYPDARRRWMLLQHYSIDTILDVGANQGQYAVSMRKAGFKGKIVSFEPLSAAYKILAEKAGKDPKWSTVQTALGDVTGQKTLNIAKKPQASSIRKMNPALMDSSDEMEFTGREEIDIQTLDSLFDTYVGPNENVYLKIDTQGYERNVIDGARHSLARIMGMQVELSLVELYEGEMVFDEMIGYIKKSGYTLMSLEPGYFDKQTGQLLQVDAIFFRENS